MKKDFQKWHALKVRIHAQHGTALFQEREIWWCALGANVGFEQDGTGKGFARPVVILKKFNLDACLIVPLTARPKKGGYYFPVGMVEEREAIAILSQVKFIDRKRLTNKIRMMDENVFRALRQAVIRASFAEIPSK